MISFIVIGRNEGWKITKCFESIFKTIEYNNLKGYEVIYVDSNSTDDSIERVKKFQRVRIFKLTGDINAAIGRNVGAYESKGGVLFFIDGDMEIQSDFLKKVYNEESGLKYDFVSGQFCNYYYDYSGKLLNTENYHQVLVNDNIEFTTGGLFLIKRDLWLKVGGMRKKLRKNEDIDFAIRLANLGIYLIRKKELMAIHHTISYSDVKRTWKMLFDGNELYRSVLMRDNFLNKFQWKYFVRTNYTSILLIIIVLFMLLIKNLSILLLYLTAILLRAMIKKVPKINRKFLYRTNLVIYFLIRDILTWFAFLFFYPKEKKKIKYIIVS
ncbi:glycosyltransferase family 2 protein [Melioribacter sp. Ez-97]|uniref:glycosyltransferase family 2 protein n=1 Tax=Melioribacter sp. Ez-97 TaxID=3423434 RepID=UPI003ED8B41A